MRRTRAFLISVLLAAGVAGSVFVGTVATSVHAAGPDTWYHGSSVVQLKYNREGVTAAPDTWYHG
jgi:hypothetical protein